MQKLKFKLAVPTSENSNSSKITGITRIPFSTNTKAYHAYYKVELQRNPSEKSFLRKIFPDFTRNGHLHKLRVTSPIKYPFLEELQKVNNTRTWTCKNGGATTQDLFLESHVLAIYGRTVVIHNYNFSYSYHCAKIMERFDHNSTTKLSIMEFPFTLIGKDIHYSESSSARLLVIIWLLSCLVISTLYVAKIVGLLAFPVFQL